MKYKKGQSFKFKDKLIKDGYPDDILYLVGNFTSEDGKRLLVLDGGSEEVVLIPESEVTAVAETQYQSQMNVLVDIAQILKLTHGKIDEIHDAILKDRGMNEDEDEECDNPDHDHGPKKPNKEELN